MNAENIVATVRDIPNVRTHVVATSVYAILATFLTDQNASVS